MCLVFETDESVSVGLNNSWFIVEKLGKLDNMANGNVEQGKYRVVWNLINLKG